MNGEVCNAWYEIDFPKPMKADLEAKRSLKSRIMLLTT